MRNEMIERFMRTIRAMSDFDRVEFVILYGSESKGEARVNSDVDICVYYRADDERDMSRFRLRLLSELPGDRFDVQIFQLLPLYVRVEVVSYQRLKPLASCFIDDLLASPTCWLHASHGLYTGLNSGYPIPTMSFQHSPSALRDAGLLEALRIPTLCLAG